MFFSSIGLFLFPKGQIAVGLWLDQTRKGKQIGIVNKLRDGCRHTWNALRHKGMTCSFFFFSLCHTYVKEDKFFQAQFSLPELTDCCLSFSLLSYSSVLSSLSRWHIPYDSCELDVSDRYHHRDIACSIVACIRAQWIAWHDQYIKK